MAKVASKNTTNKKYVAHRFVPKAHYNMFDWENYLSSQNIEKRVEEVSVKEVKVSAPKDYGSFQKISPKKHKKVKLQKIKEEKKSQNNKTDSTPTVKVERVNHLQSIGAKLIGITSALVIFSLVGITALVSLMVSKDNRINAEDNNLTINSRTATDTESRLSSIKSSVGIFLDVLDQASASEMLQQQNAEMFFDRYSDIVAIELPDSDRSFISSKFLAAYELDEKTVKDYIVSEEGTFEKARIGNTVLINASPVFETPIIAMCYSIFGNNKDSLIFVLYSAENLYESYASGAINESFFVNDNGEVLIHPDLNYLMEGTDLSNEYIVSAMLSSKLPSQQLTFTENEEAYIGAYKKLSDGSGAIITVVKDSVIVEGIQATTRRNIYLTIAILAFAILQIYFFAKTLSTPVKTLTKVANEINKGNFNTSAFDELNDNRKDEIGVLIRSTKNEREILNTFTKMTNRGVTEAIITKQIDFNPHLKDITIFFSDIRGFTAISDGFKNRFQEKSAGEIINFLNDYMSRMVNCITITGGNVDKFEGDAIMACWGVLRDDNLDFENLPDSDPTKASLKAEHDEHVVSDALSAIKATVAMRYSLAVYNKDAQAFTKAHEGEELAQYKPNIRIGSGLNSGRATVGFMGSNDKMEFTSIGDAVNLASRTESSNKPCGTDILITEDTYNLLKDKYIRCKENNFEISAENLANEIIVEIIPVTFEVKGKGKQHFYGVVNMPHFDIEGFFRQADENFVVDEECAKVIGPNGPRTLSQVRAILGIPEPDFGGVNLDEEENKIQIQAN